MTEQLHFHFSLSYTEEGNGNPLRSSCLKNSMDRGAWRAAVHGVARGWTCLSDQHFHTLTDCLDVFGFLSRAKIGNQIPE